MAQRRLEPGLAFDVREQGELQSPTLHRRATGQRRPRGNDFIDAQRTAQPVQAVPYRRINLVRAAFQPPMPVARVHTRSEEHTSELQSQSNLVCRLLLEKKK